VFPSFTGFLPNGEWLDRPIAFTKLEIAEHIALIEKLFWSNRRPPLNLHNQVREGQHFTGQSIELFYVRLVFSDPRRAK
jgi:hypothetical protein